MQGKQQTVCGMQTVVAGKQREGGRQTSALRMAAGLPMAHDTC